MSSQIGWTPIRRPTAITIIALALGIIGGLAVLTGSYLVTSSILRATSIVPGLGLDELLTVLVLSIGMGFLTALAAGFLWGRKPGARQFGLGASMVVLVTSIVAQLSFATPVMAIGISWVATLVCGIALLVLGVPTSDVRSYLRMEPGN